MNKRRTLCLIMGVENNLEIVEKCLNHLDFVDEMIITDLSDNDEIEQWLKAKYPHAKHFYDVDKNLKNRHLKYQDRIESDYLLILSYDEFITAELAEEIKLVLNAEDAYDGYAMRSIECSYGCRYKNEEYFTTRIIKKGLLLYSTDNVHEEPKVKGNVKRLENYYEHHSNPYLMVTAFKIFKYEQINASNRNIEELNKKNLLNLTPQKLQRKFFMQLAKITYRMFINRRLIKKYGFMGYCQLWSTVIRSIAEDIAPTNEIQFRSKTVSRDQTYGLFKP